MKRDVTVQALLEWAYAVERVAVSGGGGLLEAERRAAGVFVPGRSMTGALADQAALGARVAGGGGLSCCHDDAELVERVVTSRVLTPDERGLIVHHATTRSAPDWLPLARHRLEPRRRYKRARANEWMPEVTTAAPGRAGLVPAYCPLVERDAPETVARARGQYTLWREALFVVFGEFQAAGRGLRAHVLVGGFPPPSPWTPR
jgi:hypothetical protein